MQQKQLDQVQSPITSLSLKHQPRRVRAVHATPNPCFLRAANSRIIGLAALQSTHRSTALLAFPNLGYRLFNRHLFVQGVAVFCVYGFNLPGVGRPLRNGRLGYDRLRA